MTRLEVHPDARDELEDAGVWYERKAAGLGDDSLDEVGRAIETIRKSPNTWPLSDPRLGARRFLIHHVEDEP